MALMQTPDQFEKIACPEFSLLGVDGQTYTLKHFKNGKPFVIMFICNHCPYVKAIEDRLITLGQDFKNHGISLVAICSNDPVSYPEDNFENLKKRWTEKKYSFPYLYDDNQEVAKTFGAVCTPDFFGFDQNLKLAYRGRLDDSWKEPSQVTRRELFDFMLALTKNQTPPIKQTPSMGCSIKWIKT